MKLKSIEIKNFRNFENIKVGMSNQNVVFGMNDVGKTNLLFALRFLLDRDVRKNGFVISDFHLSDTSKKIEILLEIDTSDYENDDTKKVVSRVKGARTKENLDSFYFKLEGEFEEKELFGNPILLWGN
ncbi:AAA family ATPase, partial [Peribacillus frigoritolerans]|uniref:AAA family ATPase n=1 Tax=Peribacillus frigoritolerans TaxID=450367 RepID=UPI001E4DE2C8